MASINLVISPATGGAMSSWTGYESGYGQIRYTTPTTDGFMATLSRPAELSGATIQSVSIRITGNGSPGTTYARYNGTAISMTEANLLEKLQNGEDNIQVYFSYRATGGTGGEGTHYASYTWSSVVVSVVYTPAGAVNGTVTVGDASVFYSIDRRSLCAPETAPLSLSITPTANVTNIRAEIRAANNTDYDSFSVPVTAPAGSTTTTSVTISLTNAIPTNRVMGAQLRFAVTFASGDVVTSNWTATALNLVLSRNAPTLTAAFSDASTAYQLFGAYIQGQTDLSCQLTTALDTQADPEIYLTSRTLSIAGNTYSAGNDTISIGALSTSGQVTYTISATDNYGKTGTLSGTLSVVPYAAPALTALSMQRYDPDTLELDDGSDRVWLNASGSVSAINSQNAWALTVDYTNGETSGSATMETGTDGRAITHLKDTAALAAALSEQYEWTLTVTLTDRLGSVSYTLILPKSGGIFNIEKHGVSVGMRSTASSSDKKFECAFDAHFYGGIYDAQGNPVSGEDTGWQALTLDSTCAQATDFAPCAVRRVGKLVLVRGAVNLTSSMTSSSTTPRALCTLPDGFRPPYNMRAGAAAGTNATALQIDADGTVKLWNHIGAALGTNQIISLTATFTID